MSTNKQSFKTLNLIYFALIMGQTLFALVVFFIKGEIAIEDLSPFNMIVPILSMSTIGLSYFLYNKMKASGQKLEGVHAKFNHYRTSNIVRFAMLEGGNLFAIVIVLLTGSTFFYLFFSLFYYFLFNREVIF